MSNIKWKVEKFYELAGAKLFDVLQLRVDVFVVEQQCAYPELDGYDRHAEARHLSGYDESGLLIAYSRLLPPGLRFSEVTLGRFVVKREARGQGLGHRLLRQALQEIHTSWPGCAVRISAQDYLRKFYEQYGFVRMSDVYLEYGISHVEMVKKG